MDEIRLVKGELMSEVKLAEKLLEFFRRHEKETMAWIMSNIWVCVPMHAFLASNGYSFAAYAKAQQALTKAMRTYMYENRVPA